jgi:hypothetical protein
MEKLLDNGNNHLMLVKLTNAIMANLVIKVAKSEQTSHNNNQQNRPPYITTQTEAQEEAG